MQPLFSISVHDIDAGGLARSFELPLSWLEHVLADTDITATEPGQADVRLSRTGNDVIVRGKVKVTLTEPCARCLRPAVFPIEGEISLLLRPHRAEASAGKHGPYAHGAAAGKHTSHAQGPQAKDAAKRPGGKDAPGSRDVRPSSPRGNGAPRRHDDEDEYEFSSDEAEHDAYDGEVVVLDPFLREALLLEAPSFPLCSEDCPGIRPATRTAPQREEAIDPRLSPLRALKTKLRLAPGPEAGSAPSPLPGEEASEAPAPGDAEQGPARAAARPARVGQPPRPKIQAHRTAGSIGAKGASKKSRSKAKSSPPKKAK
jgi:uncharacterized protein